MEIVNGKTYNLCGGIVKVRKIVSSINTMGEKQVYVHYVSQTETGGFNTQVNKLNLDTFIKMVKDN